MIFPSLHYDCMFRGYVYDNVASIKIDSMCSHKASIMLSPLFFSHHLTKGEREREQRGKWDAKDSEVFSPSHLLLLYYSLLVLTITSRFLSPYKQQHHQQQLHFRKNHCSSFSISSTRCYCFLLVCRYIRIYLISNSSLDRSNQT